MSSEEPNGKMSSSGTRSPPVANDGEIPENPIGEEQESLERSSTEENYSSEEAASAVNPIGEELNSAEENDSGEEAASASAVNPLSNDAAQILPLLQNLLVSNDIQRERLTGLFQLYAPPAAAEEANANVNTEEDVQAATEAENSQTAREAELSSQVHFLEQRVQMLEEEIEHQKNLNAQLEEQIRSLTTTSDP